MWSLGVILHVLLCYKLPFEAESTALLYKKIRQGLIDLPSHLQLSAAELLRRMLEVEPGKRISLPQVLQSPWLQLQPCLPSVSLVVDGLLDQTYLTVDTAHSSIAASSIQISEPNVPRCSSDTDIHLSRKSRGYRFSGNAHFRPWPKK